MDDYLGEEIVSVEGTPWENYTQADWALLWIEKYGQFDGGHHKQWTLDQVARILNGTKVVLKLAKWGNGYQEYRFDTDEPSQKYLDWAQMMLGDYDHEEEEYEYSYDVGIAP